MPDILHRVGIRSQSMQPVYHALTTQAGLAGWWTSNTQGEGDQVGNIIEFRFGAGGFDMKVAALEEPNTVLWELADGPPEWMGTTISFELRQEDQYVILIFKHANWKEPVEFMHHCSTKWAVFLLSLKSLIEEGEGKPDPRDIKIDNWN
ncbi:SRPBCC domain-containing protein [Dyadobacter sp. CY347]|uniref:SRPBCC family protein n=1 Tax=Dyadobacter sp. CY347 TaxID=2909336 RepID=UPI001F1DF529|nr:SRPBCC domain-containing protein [Dyadobacter sp. CY347]MCF2489323.1 SRPBCC domain-containing protein [Dyadobacter sp. CY347]